MSHIGRYVYDIQEDIEAGILTFAEIADKFGTTVDNVSAIADSIVEYRNYTEAAQILLDNDLRSTFYYPKVQ